MSSAALEDELNIPAGATLSVQSKTNAEIPSLVAVSSGSSIPISPKTSINNSTKFLLVGRQANTSDIRINHKSISRKHAALYFLQDNGTSNVELFLKDLGGKYGCSVNGTKVDKNGISVLKPGDKLILGNVREQVFSINIPTDVEILRCETKEGTKEVQNNAKAPENEIEKENDNDDANETGDSKTGLTGRAAREAEIAAMMESLDQTPSYTKYKPVHDNSNTVSVNAAESKKVVQTTENIKKDSRVPVTNSITIPPPANNSGLGKSNSSLATTLSLDPAGSRLLVGMSNATVQLYDFNGMDLSLQPFKNVAMQEGRYSIVSTTFSNSGDRLIVGTTSAQPIILDRDGDEIIEFNKGDMYVTDMARTDGHVANITGVDWHPFERDLVLTASLDGSVRLWDLERGKTKFEKLCCGKQIYRIKSSMGKKSKVTCVKFSPTGREFACGTSCGSIQVWSSMKVGSRPDKVLYDAHGKNVAIHSLVYNYDGTKIASRCTDDDCVKVWEARKLSRSAKPFLSINGLKSQYEYSNSSFSPDGKFFCVGTSVEPSRKSGMQTHPNTEKYGQLKIYNLANGRDPKPFVSIDIAEGVSVITCCWHKKLNQIILGLSDGSVRIFYDPVHSSKGALLPVSKGLKKQDDLSLLLASRAPTGSAGINFDDIQTPNALPMFRDPERNTKRKREKERQDPVKSKRPDMPGTGIKAGEGTSAGLNFQQYNLTSAIQKNKNIAGKDPRNELFKYKEGKSYTKVSYDGDVKVLAEKTAEQEEEENKDR